MLYSTVLRSVFGKYLGLAGFSPVLPTPAYPRAQCHTTQFIGGLTFNYGAFSTKSAIAAPPDQDSVNRDSVYSNSHGGSAVTTNRDQPINNTWFKHVRLAPRRVRQPNVQYASTHRYGFATVCPEIIAILLGKRKDAVIFSLLRTGPGFDILFT